jgi:hypothetical protein
VPPPSLQSLRATGKINFLSPVDFQIEGKAQGELGLTGKRRRVQDNWPPFRPKIGKQLANQKSFAFDISS